MIQTWVTYGANPVLQSGHHSTGPGSALLAEQNSLCGGKITGSQQPGRLQLVRVWHQGMWHHVRSLHGATTTRKRLLLVIWIIFVGHGFFPVFFFLWISTKDVGKKRLISRTLKIQRENSWLIKYLTITDERLHPRMHFQQSWVIRNPDAIKVWSWMGL